MNGARESSISVAVRVRPFTSTESQRLVRQEPDTLFLGDASFDSGATPNKASPRSVRKIVDVVDDKMLIFDPPDSNPLWSMQTQAFPKTKSRLREYRFVFDKLFDGNASQDDVYSGTTLPLLDSILDGFNATVFAYGATGCGKTHTILGSPQDPGIIFLTMKELFKRIDDASDTKNIQVSLSFLEIYNESIRDLLKPETPCKKLMLREDANHKISVLNLSSHRPESVDDVMLLLMQGNANRTSSPTEANATSSRSHAVLQINVQQRNRTAEVSEKHTFATLSIIDLAGSERAAATKNTGARLNEGANINRSLLALGNCINALCDPRRRNHVPYRDLKLTRLLKFSLGGNCKTVMIVCISPSSHHYDETLNTLKYADRAKEIKTKLIRNEHNLDRHVGSYLKMITEQKQEIDELRNRELSVVQATADKCSKMHLAIISTILQEVASTKSAIEEHSQEIWRKYYLLAKRKLLLLLQAQTASLSTYLGSISSSLLSKVIFHVNELRGKIDKQIVHLETQYDAPGQIENIFNHSTTHTLKRLSESEGWCPEHTTMFRKMMASILNEVEKDVLVNSSILFDYLVAELDHFNCLPRVVRDLIDIVQNEKENVDITEVINTLVHCYEQMNNGHYDSVVEQLTSSFIQQLQLQGQEPPTQIPTLHPKIHSKRGSTSPLRSSSPRATKKLTKSPVAKKVRWDHDMSMESDLSIEEGSPPNISINNSILDELDFKFDPSLDSPPASKIHKMSFRKTRPLTSRKLPTSEQDDSLKPALLNKQASKIVSLGHVPSLEPTKVITGSISDYNTETKSIGSSEGRVD